MFSAQPTNNSVLIFCRSIVRIFCVKKFLKNAGSIVFAFSSFIFMQLSSATDTYHYHCKQLMRTTFLLRPFMFFNEQTRCYNGFINIVRRIRDNFFALRTRGTSAFNTKSRCDCTNILDIGLHLQRTVTHDAM